MSLEFLAAALLLLAAMLLARLPTRPRLGLLYLGLATITIGALTYAGAPGNWRYLAASWVGIYVGVLSWISEHGRAKGLTSRS